MNKSFCIKTFYQLIVFMNNYLDIISRMENIDEFIKLYNSKKPIVIGKPRLENIYVCEKCNKDTLFDEFANIYSCPQCGQIQNGDFKSELMIGKRYRPRTQYKKINHFKQLLNQYQAYDENVPKNIIRKVKMNIRKNNISEISIYVIKDSLRKLKLTKYYENIFQIYYTIFNIDPPILNYDTVKSLCDMFDMFNDAYIGICKGNNNRRKNMIRYSFLLNKFFLMLGMPEHAKYFKGLKNSEKQYELEKIFAHVCKVNRWKNPLQVRFQLSNLVF